MTSNIIRALILNLTLIIPTVSAHHSIAENYDVQKTIMLKGELAALRFADPHSMMFLDVRDGTGKKQRWIVEGNAATILTHTGWTHDRLAPGNEFTVVALLPKRGANLAATLPPIDPDSPEGVQKSITEMQAIVKAGRFVHGTQVTCSDGKTLGFGDSK